MPNVKDHNLLNGDNSEKNSNLNSKWDYEKIVNAIMNKTNIYYINRVIIP